jgi:hypothetical protein
VVLSSLIMVWASLITSGASCLKYLLSFSTFFACYKTIALLANFYLKLVQTILTKLASSPRWVSPSTIYWSQSLTKLTLSVDDFKTSRLIIIFSKYLSSNFRYSKWNLGSSSFILRPYIIS